MMQKNTSHKLKSTSNKPQIIKPQAKILKLTVINYKPLRNWGNAFGFQLLAFSFWVTSFGTNRRLLWRRSVGIRFSIASSFLGYFQTFFKAFFNIRLLVASFKVVAFSLLLCTYTNVLKAQRSHPSDTTYAVTDSSNIYYDDTTDISNEIDTTKIDSEKITAAIILLSEDSIKSLRRSNGFGYMSYIDSLLKAREAEKKQHPQKPPQQNTSGISFWDFGLVQLLCWAVAIGVVGFVLYRLFIGQGGAFASNAKNNIPQVDMDEEPNLDDLEGQLKKAVQAGKYRLATRYLFLKTLQQLSDKNAISLSAEKTNIQYSQELKGKSYADSFARLCLLYEYVWFGEFDINAEQFASIQQEQQLLSKAI